MAIPIDIHFFIVYTIKKKRREGHGRKSTKFQDG